MHKMHKPTYKNIIKTGYGDNLEQPLKYSLSIFTLSYLLLSVLQKYYGYLFRIYKSPDMTYEVT